MTGYGPPSGDRDPTSYGWYSRPPPYHPPGPYGWPPPPPPPKRRGDASMVALAVGLPILALVLIGVVVVVVTRGDASPRPGYLATLTQATAVDASIESYWARALPRETGTRFRPARLEHYSGRSSSSCNRPPGELEAFYCPRDEAVFVSTAVYEALEEAMLDARAAAFARAVLLAHEYGHHVQLLIGTIREAGDTGHDVARLELQADCFAGLWAHAVWRSEESVADPLRQTPRSSDIDFTFRLIGDVAAWDPDAATTRAEVHGSAEQREAWFMSGYVEGDLAACDTSENVGPDGFPA